jgi:hypothetical protein
LTIAGVKYSSSESAGVGRRASDNELPPATLSCEISSVESESNDSVAQGVQPESEVESVWCRNILADHPSWAQSADHGEEIAGEVGVPSGTITPSEGA